MILKKELLRELGKQGFFVSPGEEGRGFIKRIKLLKKMSQAHAQGIPLHQKNVQKMKGLPSDQMENVIGCLPLWIPVYYSNRKLMAWQGAVTWISSLSKEVNFPSIQIKPSFKKGRHLGIPLEDVLLHELLHGVRANYPSSRFEEIFAYHSSSHRWRTWIGPIFRKPYEVWIFMFTLLVPLGGQFFEIMFLSTFSSLICSLFSLPLTYLGFLIIRLSKDFSTFKKSLKKIGSVFSKNDNPFSIALRMTDREITSFAYQPMDKLKEYIGKKRNSSLRWQQILAQFSERSDTIEGQTERPVHKHNFRKPLSNECAVKIRS